MASLFSFRIAGNRYDFLDGTFAPDLRASLSPIATACFLLFTLLPLPDFSFPSLNSFIVLPTFSCALSEYFFAMISEFKLANKDISGSVEKHYILLLFCCIISTIKNIFHAPSALSDFGNFALSNGKWAGIRPRHCHFNFHIICGQEYPLGLLPLFQPIFHTTRSSQISFPETVHSDH